MTQVEPEEPRREEHAHSPLKANMEPFFICMKASKGLPLQTSASGSGASVVPVVTAAVVVVTRLVLASGARVVKLSAGGSVGVADVDASGRGRLIMSSVVSVRWYSLRPKSVNDPRVGFSRRLPVGIGDGEAPSSGSSS